jgi:hypothetical protein
MNEMNFKRLTTYPSREYTFVNISAITTKEVTDGRKKVARKKFANRNCSLLTNKANSNAKQVEIGTVTRVKIVVVFRDFQNN